MFSASSGRPGNELRKKKRKKKKKSSSVVDGSPLKACGDDTHIKPIAIQANETARQNRLTIKIKVVFKNKYDTKLDFSTTFSRYRDFSSDENLNSIEETLIEEICNELVEDVFNKAVVNW